MAKPSTPEPDPAELVSIVHPDIEGTWGPVPRSALASLPQWSEASTVTPRGGANTTTSKE